VDAYKNSELIEDENTEGGAIKSPSSTVFYAI
jgi:hypothetical protein